MGPRSLSPSRITNLGSLEASDSICAESLHCALTTNYEEGRRGRGGGRPRREETDTPIATGGPSAYDVFAPSEAGASKDASYPLGGVWRLAQSPRTTRNALTRYARFVSAAVAACAVERVMSASLAGSSPCRVSEFAGYIYVKPRLHCYSTRAYARNEPRTQNISNIVLRAWP
jgi:hypothetical protein